jgi:hypothetical protein
VVRWLVGSVWPWLALPFQTEAESGTLDTEPTQPAPGVIEQLQAYLADALTTGAPTERKAAIETLIAEIRITDQGVIPVFRIPTSPPPPSSHDETPATATDNGSHNGEVGGAGGARTHDRRIMSPLL